MTNSSETYLSLNIAVFQIVWFLFATKLALFRDFLYNHWQITGMALRHKKWMKKLLYSSNIQFASVASVWSCTSLLLFGTFELATSKPLEIEKSLYLKRKPNYPLFERNFETGRIFVMEGSRRVLVDRVLFQSTSTKTYLEPSMAKIHPVSKLLSKNGW